MEAADPFAWMIELCQPTDSQANYPNTPVARMSEYFADSSSDPVPYSSVDPMPTEATEIFMMSLPGSVHERAEDESLFHTPPEHHPPPSHLSSSEDQNLDEGALEGHDRRKEVRASEAGMGDGPEAKRLRSMEYEETVPVGETEVIVEETEIIVDLGEEEEEVIETNGKRIEDIDKFRYDKQSLKGREKEESGLLEFLPILKVLFAKTDDGSEDDENEDYFAMIQRKGFTFPRPRWW
ncbi:hypothetical protein ACS0TY_001485 [Phlomoides rotata]